MAVELLSELCDKVLFEKKIYDSNAAIGPDLKFIFTNPIVVTIRFFKAFSFSSNVISRSGVPVAFFFWRGIVMNFFLHLYRDIFDESKLVNNQNPQNDIDSAYWKKFLNDNQNSIVTVYETIYFQHLRCDFVSGQSPLNRLHTE